MKSISPKKNSIKKPSGFPIVAVGAASGGAEAFSELLKHLPVNTGMAYVYIQHADDGQNGNLVEVF